MHQHAVRFDDIGCHKVVIVAVNISATSCSQAYCCTRAAVAGPAVSKSSFHSSYHELAKQHLDDTMVLKNSHELGWC